MCALPAPEWIDGLYAYSVFTNLYEPWTQNGDFLENGCNDFDSVSVIY
jgi:hypothetical protein